MRQRVKTNLLRSTIFVGLLNLAAASWHPLPEHIWSSVFTHRSPTTIMWPSSAPSTNDVVVLYYFFHLYICCLIDVCSGFLVFFFFFFVFRSSYHRLFLVHPLGFRKACGTFLVSSSFINLLVVPYLTYTSYIIALIGGRFSWPLY
jgi:hypothetical protein